MFSYVKNAYDEFWDESHWLPPGYNWSSLKSTEFEHYPQFTDLRLPIYYAFVFLVARMIFEWSIARPLGCYMGIENTTSALPNIFYRIYCYSRKLFAAKSDHLASNGHALEDDQYVKESRGLIPKSTLDKFAECCWRFTFYLFAFIYGLYTLWDKPYFTDTKHCWFGYPMQPITNDVYWYYMLEMSFYWSLIMSQFFDVRRKDFWVNFVHHIATILLLGFSYGDSFLRIGALVLLTHDAADPWLEATKMTRYCKKIAVCNTLFVIFAFVWIITRCVYFPFWIIYSTLVEGVALVGFYEAYYVFNILLITLFALHLFWTYLILRIFVSTVRSGQMDDERSDDEEDEDPRTKTGKKENKSD